MCDGVVIYYAEMRWHVRCGQRSWAVFPVLEGLVSVWLRRKADHPLSRVIGAGMLNRDRRWGGGECALGSVTNGCFVIGSGEGNMSGFGY